VSGLETLSKDMGAQEYWIRRLVALVIDAVVVSIALFLIGLEPVSFRLISISTLGGFALFAYTVVLEYLRGQTFGKMVMGLRVVGVREKVDLSRLLIREISKVHVVLLLLDVVVGVLVEKNGRQRYLETLSATTEVVDRAPSRPAPGTAGAGKPGA
jgi:uncharacterized RDD family membrane protein YckC